MRCPTTFLIAVALLLVAASAAEAAPPPNDARSAAQRLTIPANAQGTTVEATLDEDEPPGCVVGSGTVWYTFSVNRPRQILVALDAGGDMDGTVEVFSRARSQLQSVGCANTNNRGEATLDLDAAADTQYLIRVAPLLNSVRAGFRLRVVAPDEPARAPGERLPGDGTSGELDRFANGDDAWAVQMREGHTYRINLVTRGDGCVRGALYAPGNFRAAEEESLDCDEHVVYTPRSSGTYSSCSTHRAARATGSPTGSAPGSRSATTPRRGSRSPTTGACAARSPATSSTPSTCTASRSRGAPTSACAWRPATTSPCA